MSVRACLIAALVLTGCATHHRPDYDAITDLVPDCANRDAQIRYLWKLKSVKTQPSDDESLYNQTIEMQIQRLVLYCSK